MSTQPARVVPPSEADDPWTYVVELYRDGGYLSSLVTLDEAAAVSSAHALIDEGYPARILTFRGDYTQAAA